MNTRLLEYLVAVVKMGSFRQAADYCGVSQPALSIQIKKLETLLGATLIERNNKDIVLTAAGKETVKRAELILKDIKELNKVVSLTSDPYSGELSLGAFPTLSPYIFPKIVNELKETYPRLNFSLVEDKTGDLINMLKSGELDAAFIAHPFEHKDMNSFFLFKEDFMLAVPENHTLTRSKNINSNELMNHEIMLLEEGHCLRDQALQVCSANIMKDETFRASSLTTLIQMVRLGNGITLIPECAAAAIDGITYIPITGSTPSRSISLFWRKSSVRDDILMEIADDIKRSW